MKKTLIIIILFSSYVFSQTGNSSQSIELPAFVITGVRSVSLPTLNKKKSEFVPVIGESFLTPRYDTEEYALLDNTTPVKKEMELYSNVNRYNGLLKLGAGLQTLPIGSLALGFDKGNFLFNTHVFGSDDKEYIPYAGYNTSGATVDISYFVNHKASAFPGMTISAKGGFLRDLYNYYGTDTPTLSRENGKYNWGINLENRINKNFMYGASFDGNYLDIKSDGITENISKAKGFMEFKIGALFVGTNGFYEYQQVNNNILGYSKYDYYGGDLYFKFLNSDYFNIKLGANYSQQDTNSVFAPMAVVSIFVEKGTALFLSYEGGSELITLNNFLSNNRYFEIGNNNIFQKDNSKITVAIKYDFSDVFEINAGFYSSNYDNYHYFEDVKNDNRFYINVINDVDELGAFFNILINAKSYGELFADFEFMDVRNSSRNVIPYKPLLSGSLSYGYHFNFGIYSKIKVEYSSTTYTDLLNTNKLPNYINLGLSLKYNFINSIALTCDLQNLLDRDNYLLKGYLEKPLDVIVGVEYRW